jgi:hypothetical protein
VFPSLAAICVLVLIVRIYFWRNVDRGSFATFFASILLLAAACTTASCGGSSASGHPSVPGTSPGTYTITVKATATTGSNTLSHSTALTLVVQ